MPGYMSGDRVRFGNPDYDAIKEEGLLCADMHFHTHYSDSFTTIPQAMKLAKRRGVGFAVTDHNMIGGALEAYELNRGGDQFIVPGIEISSWDGPHILVYFYTIDEMKEYWERCVKPNLSKAEWLAIDKGTEWILDSLEDVNCVISGAHPLGYFFSVKGVQKAINHRMLEPEIAKRFDAYEVVCSGMFRKENIGAREYADSHGIGYTGGTDGHMLSELGHVLTVSDATDLDGFLDGIRKKTNVIVGREKYLPEKTIMALACCSRFCTVLPQSVMRKIELMTNSGTKNFR